MQPLGKLSALSPLPAAVLYAWSHQQCPQTNAAAADMLFDRKWPLY